MHQQPLDAPARPNRFEAYPIDTEVPGSSRNLFTGTAAIFRRAGFRTLAARTPARPIMRHGLR